MALYHSGELAGRVKAAGALLRECSVCPHCCSVNRIASETGKCNTAMLASASSYSPHFGEELLLVGKMAQYRPCHKASQMPHLSRILLEQELEDALRLTLRGVLSRLDSANLLTDRFF